MKKVFQCWDGGVDSFSGTVIGHCATKVLAAMVVKGRGVFGHGDGEIRPIRVWENISDLPKEVKKRMEKNGVLKDSDVFEEKVRDLHQVLTNASPEVRAAVLAKLK
jgi:hypothetical protein